ncbi:hypothetical protein HA402_004743 [Bradysia odoriphaga]|nr:hypothetical protein HA402_004743 [Bradysia odoriphaga]
MIENSGYPAELHTVVTEDNYILGLHRIPTREPTPKVALLMHGLYCSAAEFIVTGRSSSLAYFLADNGFDVWLANSRGNEFSKDHKFLASNSTPYWNFSFHEMAKYDLPTVIDHILMTTNQSALHYVARFLQYDHKHLGNLEVYNQTTPPSYRLSNVAVRIHFLYGTNDFLASYFDVEGLMRKFKTSTVGIDKFFGWNHADFLIGKEVNTVNRKILGIMNQYNGVPTEGFVYN